MYNVRLVPMPSTTGGRLYRMGARSVREGWPPVDLGDVVLLRQLSHDTQSWQGIQFEGVIHAINRSAGEISKDALSCVLRSLKPETWQLFDATDLGHTRKA